MAARATTLALSILLRPWLAILVVGLFVALPSFLLIGVVTGDTTAHLQRERLEEHRRAAQTGAQIVGSRVAGLTDNLTVVANSRFMKDAIARRSVPTLAILVTEFRPVLGLQNDVLVFFAEDKAGDLLAIDPHDPALIGKNYATRDYFVGVSREWKPFVSEAFRGGVQGSPPTTVVAVPLIAPDGSPAGVLGAALDLSQAAKWFAPLAAYEDVYLIDRNGRLITHTRDPLGDSLRELGGDPAVKTILSGRQILGEAADPLGRGTKVLGSAPVPGVDWHVIVVDEPHAFDDAFSPLLKNILLVRISLVALILLLTLALSYVVRGLVAQRAELAASERSARLAHEQADAANRHKSEFLANMSHELRTPLNAIIGFSDLLREQLDNTLNDRQKRYLGNVREAGDHLLGLINDVLDLSKVEAGRIEIRAETIVLDTLLAPVLASAHETARKEEIHLDVTAHENVSVRVDSGRIRQVLYNLLSNAVKFTPAGGRVSLHVAAKDGTLEFAVVDTGMGIPADQQHRVFGTFERLHEGRSQVSGTGLGLALTKRLVELHGGAIDFTSREGEGTTFRVRIPNVVIDMTAHRRVLIVEDERRDADLLIALAAKHGLATEVATTVEEARNAILRSVPCGVVLDLRLPDGRGERILELLKSDAATQRVPVVVVTVEDDEGHSRPLGADDHLTKPIDHARLDGWLGQVAARRGMAEVA